MNLGIEKLEIRVKDFHLRCQDLDFNTGDIFLIAAPNGSGKSMFLKAVAGLVKTKYRKIKIDDVSVENFDLSKVMAAYLGEEFLVPFYRPIEYFELIGKTRGMDSLQIKTSIQYLSNMFDQKWPEKYIRELSTGMKKKVGLVASLIGDAQVILWDEPFENVDNDAKRSLEKFMENEKRLIIYSSPSDSDLPFSKKLTIVDGCVLLENEVS